MEDLILQQDAVNSWMQRLGVRFGLYKNGNFKEQIFPFDPIPRKIEAQDWEYLERGLIQRVNALNLYLADIYGGKSIVKSGVVPEEFAISSSGYLPQCEGIVPSKGIYSHISGIDLVHGKDKVWYILEDNLRIPSGASYPMIARTITRKVSPQTFADNNIHDNRGYADLLREMMDYVCVDDGIAVILTPGRYNSAYFEHSYLAEKTGAILAYNTDLRVEGDYLYYIGIGEEKQRVGVVYRRISDEYMDPFCFKSESLIGVPNIMQVYRKGNVAIVNAPGNGAADDKGIYYFVPKMIRYYLNEEPILKNAPTYLPFYETDRKYVLEHIRSLVIKDVAEAGGYGVVFGEKLSEEKLKEMKELIIKEPRRWIAQEVIDFQDLPIMDGEKMVERKADLRVYVVSGEETKVWPCGLTRFTRNPDSFIVNSSQGGGFKDTWVLKQ
jgi:uncharacterized circularly permuted ATP-grasp superfamily protein